MSARKSSRTNHERPIFAPQTPRLQLHRVTPRRRGTGTGAARRASATRHMPTGKQERATQPWNKHHGEQPVAASYYPQVFPASCMQSLLEFSSPGKGFTWVWAGW
ncbi:uncharacterized protein CIMG_12839 [Coccidioides immitis RS]|uniref:Uncharacterized protein n=1 Tax=Coccidioides immitis (strain RS) TaxID=246410 RepID=J3KHP6_COCIM|nr:uncharacterized protein CIMG_12839 [Coccidioides immitis RS]EAS35413.3 hypothetical protein CIMG_12839 [Coccidioides immitis RS]